MEVCSQGIFMVTASLRGPLTLMNINEVPPGMVEGGTCQVSTECSKAQARNCWARWENVFLIHSCRNSKTFQGKIMNAFKTRWGQSFFWEEIKIVIRPRGKTKMGFWGWSSISFQSCHSMFKLLDWVKGRQGALTWIYSSKSKITDLYSWVIDFVFSYNLHSQFICNSPSGKF